MNREGSVFEGVIDAEEFESLVWLDHFETIHGPAVTVVESEVIRFGLWDVFQFAGQLLPFGSGCRESCEKNE